MPRHFGMPGNIGPVGVTGDFVTTCRIGEVLGEGCGLLGLFGVDFILHDGRPWAWRSTHGTRRRSKCWNWGPACWRCRCTGWRSTRSDGTSPATSRGTAGRRQSRTLRPADVVMPAYDPSRYREHILGDEVRAARHLAGVHFVDIPAPGEVIERGWPVLTILAEGENRERRWPTSGSAPIASNAFCSGTARGGQRSGTGTPGSTTPPPTEPAGSARGRVPHFARPDPDVPERLRAGRT